MLRDRRAAHVEVRSDVTGGAFGVPDEAEDLTAARLRDRLQRSLHALDVSRRLRERQRPGSRIHPERVRSTIPSEVSAAVAVATAATERPVRSASTSMLADGTVRAGSGPPHRAPGGGSPRTPTVGGRTTCPACRHRGTGSRRPGRRRTSAPAGRRDARCPSTPGSTRPAPRDRATCPRHLRGPGQGPRPVPHLGSPAPRPAARCRQAPRPVPVADRRHGGGRVRTDAGESGQRLRVSRHPPPRALGRRCVRSRAARRRRRL